MGSLRVRVPTPPISDLSETDRDLPNTSDLLEVRKDMEEAPIKNTDYPLHRIATGFVSLCKSRQKGHILEICELQLALGCHGEASNSGGVQLDTEAHDQVETTPAASESSVEAQVELPGHSHYILSKTLFLQTPSKN